MTKRIFAAVIAIAMVCTMFAFASSAAETTTVAFDKSASYTWYNYLNALNVIPDSDSSLADLRANGTPYKIFLNELLAIMNGEGGAGADGAYMNSYYMSQDGLTGTLLYNYVQDTFGAYAYILRGGKQMAVDYWNAHMQTTVSMDADGYTYVPASAQTVYAEADYEACVTALNSYMTTANDNYCFNVENGGGRYLDQKGKYEALVAAVDACAATVALVDMTGLTSDDYVTQLLINFYNNVDVESYRAKEVVQTWAAALKAGVEAGLAYDAILIDGVDACTLWESTIRYEVLLNMGARTAADAVMNDASLWPLGSAVIDLAQTTYKAAQYQEVYDLWVQIRDEYKANLDIKTSEVIAACDTLKAKIQALEVASLPFTTEQKQAVQVLETFVPYYRARVNRVVLETNKATDMYVEYVALVEEAEGYIALDWTNGTSESYPSVETMENLLLPGAEGGLLETNWYPFRLAFGLDNQGYDAVIAAAVAEWEASGLYTDASIAAVKESVANFEVATMTGARGLSNTDEQTQGDVEIYKAMLEANPALPTFKVASANLTLNDSISVNFKVNKDVYDAYENVYAVITFGDSVITITDPVYHAEDNQRYYFTCPNIGPHRMMDTISITLYGTAYGQEYTNTVEYSIYKDCSSQINKATAFKTIATDLLNYGAAAQIYANYNTDNLANAGIDQSGASTSLADPVSDLNLTYATIENPTVAWKSASLYLEARVNAKLQFQADDLTGLTVKFVMDGKEFVVDQFEAREDMAGRYYVYFDNILPNQMRTPFTATVYRDGVAVSNTIQYSVQSYVVGKTTAGTALNDMLIAMLKYADACQAYFG